MLAIEASGRTAMAELRHLLGLLAPSGDAEELLDAAQTPRSALRHSPAWTNSGQLIDRVPRPDWRWSCA